MTPDWRVTANSDQFRQRPFPNAKRAEATAATTGGDAEPYHLLDPESDMARQSEYAQPQTILALAGHG